MAPAGRARSRCSRLTIPQSVVVFGHGGLERHDPDYYAGYVANYILGGGGFSSRLLEEVREKRGLAYSAYSYLHELDKSPLWLGGVATNNQQVAQSLAHRPRRAGADGARASSTRPTSPTPGPTSPAPSPCA